MHELPILKDIVILLSASILTSLIFHRLKVPSIVGFILGGLIIGPFGVGLIGDIELVNVMAEIGVVLLLFTIGIEFSIDEILKIGLRGLTAAVLQVVITVGMVYGLSSLFGMKSVQSFFIGCVIALSSTAIVIRLYKDRGEMGSPKGRLSLGTLLTQDLAIVPMVLLVQIFGKGGDGSMMGAASAIGIALLAVTGIILSAYCLVPLFLNRVVRLRSSELLTMSGLLLCLGTAWLSSHFGLSLALGAFIAGIIISESEYSHQITASVLPFKDIFNSIFFISIGMLIRIEGIFGDLIPIILLTLLIIVFKSLIISFIFFALRYPWRVSFIVGIGLAQIGEFSFVLLKIGNDMKIISQSIYQIFLSSTVLSMILAPILIKYAPSIATRFRDLTPKSWKKIDEAMEGESSVINHVIIAGYGLMGRQMANVLNKTGIPYVVIDLNNENVKKAKAEGHKAYYGDTSYPEVLKSIGVTVAKVMVFCISDPACTRRSVKLAKDINPDLHVIVRTKYMAEITELTQLGASQVIAEEFESSVEAFSRVLKEYKVPINIIENQIDMVRLEGYSMLRGVSLPMEKLTTITSFLAKSVSESFFVEEGNPAVGKTIKELDIRGNGGATIIAVSRGSTSRTNPPAGYVVKSGDILVLLGSHAEIATAIEILKRGGEMPEESEGPEENPETDKSPEAAAHDSP